MAHNVKVLRPVAKGQPLSWDDVDSDTTTDAWKVRREMETMFAG
jgi:predicted homoserine dehydrogenase-like protein